MRKKIMALMTLLCLLMSPVCFATGANAPHMTSQKIFSNDFREQFDLDLNDLHSASSTSFAVAGKKAYQLMSSGDIYSYDLENGTYALLTHVPALPTEGYSYKGHYSALSDDVRALVDQAVFQLIGSVDGDELYGYCPTSGRIGQIDEEGVHWNDVLLDNSLQMQADPAYPADLPYARILGNELYAFHDRARSTEAPCEGEILIFHLDTGECRVVDVPGAYALTVTPSQGILLLMRNEEGMMFLCRYDPQTDAIDVSTGALPNPLTQVNAESWFDVMTCVTGVACKENQEDICFATPDGLWYWTADEQSIARVALDGTSWEHLNAYADAWFTEDGKYVLFNGSKFVVSPE